MPLVRRYCSMGVRPPVLPIPVDPVPVIAVPALSRQCTCCKVDYEYALVRFAPEPFVCQYCKNLHRIFIRLRRLGQFSPIRQHVSQVLNGLVGFLGMLVPIGLDEDTDSDASSSD